MFNQKEKTVHGVSVGADTEQSFEFNNSILAEKEEYFNSLPDDYFAQHSEMFEPGNLYTMTMNQLYDKSYDEKPAVIDGLLYQGVYIFAGAPKLGKSFLMLQLAYSVSRGEDMWGYHTNKGPVLYLALEDNYRRLQKRLYRQQGEEGSDDLHLATSAGQINDTLLEQLRGFITKYPDTKLVIIDTFQKIRDKEGESYSYANDYGEVSVMKSFADANGICLMLVHHTKKQDTEDKFDKISGTRGLLAAADGAFIMTKNARTDTTAVLDITGRDQQDQKLYLEKDPATLAWNLQRAEVESYETPENPVIKRLTELVNPANPRWAGNATQLAQWLETDIAPNTLTRIFNINSGHLKRDYGITFSKGRSHNGRVLQFEFTGISA